MQAGVVQAPQHRHALVERLPGDEACRTESHAVVLDDVLEPAARSRAEDRRPWESGQRCLDPGHAARAYRRPLS